MLTMSVKYAQTAATLDQTREELRELKVKCSFPPSLSPSLPVYMRVSRTKEEMNE